MLIDFHTHIFPEKIAGKTLNILKQNIIDKEGVIPNIYTDATKIGLLQNMYAEGVDISVVLPIATTVKQSGSINDYAESITDDRIISFGSVHPLQDDYDYILKDLKERGFKGIKLHPEYQQSFVDSKESLRILKLAEELDLIVVLHTGADIGMDPPVHCAPDRLKNVLSEVSGKRIVAAHLGGWKMWDEVEEYLVGTNLLFDTAFSFDFISNEQYERIIKNHGADKILFGTDSPWENPKKTLDGLESLNLSSAELDLIKYKNAKRILGL